MYTKDHKIISKFRSMETRNKLKR